MTEYIINNLESTEYLENEKNKELLNKELSISNKLDCFKKINNQNCKNELFNSYKKIVKDITFCKKIQEFIFNYHNINNNNLEDILLLDNLSRNELCYKLNENQLIYVYKKYFDIEIIKKIFLTYLIDNFYILKKNINSEVFNKISNELTTKKLKKISMIIDITEKQYIEKDLSFEDFENYLLNFNVENNYENNIDIYILQKNNICNYNSQLKAMNLFLENKDFYPFYY